MPLSGDLDSCAIKLAPCLSCPHSPSCFVADSSLLDPLALVWQTLWPLPFSADFISGLCQKANETESQKTKAATSAAT